MGPMAVNLDSIREAATRISNYILRTPLMESQAFAKLLGHKAPVYFKVETLQHTGSFKVRGAANKILKLGESGAKPSRIVASSAGNHAQAVSYICSRVGLPSTIVMPEAATLIKVSSTASFGAEVVLHGLIYDDAYRKAQEILKATPGSVFVHPYEDEDIMSGQGTLGIEAHEQLTELGVTQDDLQVVIPIGGGGLFTGAATALKALRPKTKVWGVVPAQVPGMALSFKAREVQVHPVKGFTLADGLAVKTVSPLSLSYISKLAEDVVTVEENEIAQAISTLMENRKLLVEGAGASGVAAVLSKKLILDPNKPVLFVLCGGNIDLNKISTIIERGLYQSHRWMKLRFKVDDKPGELAKITERLAELRANVLDVFHNRMSQSCALGQTQIDILLETKGALHASEIFKKLQSFYASLEVVEQ
jgi:threonine dehydratase